MDEQIQREIISAQKDKLLREHADILNQFNPKAASVYGTSGQFKWKSGFSGKLNFHK